MEPQGVKECKVCGEPLETHAEKVTEVHIGCFFEGHPDPKRNIHAIDIKEVGYGFTSGTSAKKAAHKAERIRQARSLVKKEPTAW